MLLNPAGGMLKQLDGDEVLEIVEHRLALAGHEVSGRLVAPSEIDAALDRAMAGPADAIVVGGGDGTVSGAAGRMVRSGCGKALGVLPLGTMNLFARGLQTPISLHHAVDALAHGTFRTVDVGEVNGRVFLHHLSFGVHPTMLRWRSLFERNDRFSRWTATAIAWGLTLRRFPHMEVQLADGGEERLWRTPLLVVTPGPFADAGAGGLVPVRGGAEGGRLCVYAMTRRTWFGLVRAAIAAVTAGWNETTSFERLDARLLSLTQRGKRAPRASVDGELMPLDAPIRCRCLDRALTILQPVTPDIVSSAEAAA